jgi:hypothetical protein
MEVLGGFMAMLMLTLFLCPIVTLLLIICATVVVAVGLIAIAINPSIAPTIMQFLH